MQMSSNNAAQVKPQAPKPANAAQIRLDQARDRMATILGGHGFRNTVDGFVELVRATIHHELEGKLGAGGKAIEAVTAPLEQMGAGAIDRALGGTGTPDAGAVAAGDALAKVAGEAIDNGKPSAADVAAAIAGVLQQMGLVS